MRYKIAIADSKFDIEVGEIQEGTAEVAVNGKSYRGNIENYAEINYLLTYHQWHEECSIFEPVSNLGLMYLIPKFRPLKINNIPSTTTKVGNTFL